METMRRRSDSPIGCNHVRRLEPGTSVSVGFLWGVIGGVTFSSESSARSADPRVTEIHSPSWLQAEVF